MEEQCEVGLFYQLCVLLLLCQSNQLIGGPGGHDPYPVVLLSQLYDISLHRLPSTDYVVIQNSLRTLINACFMSAPGKMSAQYLGLFTLQIIITIMIIIIIIIIKVIITIVFVIIITVKNLIHHYRNYHRCYHNYNYHHRYHNN